MPSQVNLANVNISLRQFQEVASGEYNAGEVKLTGETSLGKMNNYVHRTWKNGETISHEEVVAIKSAFVKELSRNGVGAAEIAQIRRELGLGAEGAADKTLRERSLKPLSRQQIREILDRNAAALNAYAEGHPGAERIRTSAEIYGVQGQGARYTAKRDAVNASLDGKREIDENETFALHEAVIAGDIDFHPPKVREQLLQCAREQLDALCEKTNCRPDPEKPAKVTLRFGNGAEAEFDTGMDEQAYADRLQEFLARFSDTRAPGEQAIAIRKTYLKLDHAGRLAWLDGAAGGGSAVPRIRDFGLRTAAVAVLTERGVDDFDTLSLVNKVEQDDLKAFLRFLEGEQTALRGAELRETAARRLGDAARNAHLVYNQTFPAYIPVTGAAKYNASLVRFFQGETTSVAPQFKLFAKELLDELRSRYGADAVPQNARISSFLHPTAISKSLPTKGDAVQRATVESIRETMTGNALEMASSAALRKAVEAIAKELGYTAFTGAYGLANKLIAAEKELCGRLKSCLNPQEVASVVAQFRPRIEKAIVHSVESRRCSAEFMDYAAAALEKETGIPAASLAGVLDQVRLSSLANRASDAVVSGKVPAQTAADVEAVFRAEAAKFAKEKADLFAKVDALRLSQTAKDSIKAYILSIGKTSYVDVDALLEESKQIDAEAFAAALRGGGGKAAVYAQMDAIRGKLRQVLSSQLFDKGVEAGPPETTTVSTITIMMALDRTPGAGVDLAAFLAKPEVQADVARIGMDLPDDDPAYSLGSFLSFGERSAAEKKAGLLGRLERGELEPLERQTLVAAAKAEGVDWMAPADAVELFKAGTKAGGMLKFFVESFDGSPDLAQLQTIARTALRQALPQIKQAHADAQQANPQTAASAKATARLAGSPDAPVRPDTFVSGDTAATAKFAQLVETAPCVPKDASAQDKAIAFIAEMNKNAKNDVIFNIATLTSKYMVKTGDDGTKTEAFEVQHYQFARDLQGMLAVKLPGVDNIARDYNTARDQLVRFITGDDNASFATATRSVKRQTGILMAFVSQYSSTIVKEAFYSQLKRPGMESPFNSAAEGDWAFTLTKTADGSINIRLVQDTHPNLFIFGDGSQVHCNQEKSRIVFEIEMTVPKANLESLADADWTEYDREYVKDAPRDGGTAAMVERIPEKFRFTGEVSTAIHFSINS